MGTSLSCLEEAANITANSSGFSGENDDEGDEPAVPLWAVGVLLSVISCFVTALGTIQQKRAHNINDALPKNKKAREFIGILFSVPWMVSSIMMILVPLPFDFLALAFAAQSLLTPLAGVTIALNCFMAPCLLPEKLTRTEATSSVVIIFGIVLATATGSHAETQFNACTLLELYSQSTFLVPGAILSVMIGANLYSLHYSKNSKLEKWRPAMFAFLAGAFGAFNNIVFKATGELAFASESDHWGTIHPYYHIVLILGLSLMQISHINQGLRHSNAVSFLPMYNCFYIVLTSTFGGLFFGEFVGFGLASWILFPLGVVVTMGGIAGMTLAVHSVTDVSSTLTEVAVEPKG